jgi:NAD(P) transhydrogenase subunit alpha
VGPYKLGAAITGNAAWRAAIRRQLAVPLQRETTALARVVLEQTPPDFFERNREIMGQAQDQARRLCEKLEGRFGFPAVVPVGSSRQGPFLLIRLADQLVEQAGLADGWQLTELLLGVAGLETVAGPLMGLLEPIVRINVDAPRIGVKKDPALLEKVFDRLATLVQEILDGKVTYRRMLAGIGQPDQASLCGLDDRQAESDASAKIVVLTEDRPGEHRVALTPRACADLAARGMRVWVESGAGAGAGYTDATYTRAGAIVTAERRELIQDAAVLAWVKPPADLDRVMSGLPRGCRVIGLTHPFLDDTVACAAQRHGLRLESVELLAQQEIPPAQDALAAMSRFAGRIALNDALDLRDRLGHHGPQRVLVVGAGHAGLQAAQLGGVLGHSVAVASTGQRRRSRVEHGAGAAYYDIAAATEDAAAEYTVGQQQALSRVIASFRPEVIIAAAKHRGERSPCLLPAETLESLPGGTVVIDLNATRGGSVAGTQVDQRRQTGNGVWICNRSNYPSAEPAEASSAYAACLVNILTGE